MSLSVARRPSERLGGMLPRGSQRLLPMGLRLFPRASPPRLPSVQSSQSRLPDQLVPLDAWCWRELTGLHISEKGEDLTNGPVQGYRMKAEDAWGPRWVNCAHPLSHEFMRVACEKESLVVLAADLPTVEGIVQLIEDVGEYVCALKTHVDMVEGFNMEDWSKVVDAARSKGMLLFEDRKFADIGRVAQTQMGGLYDIRSWADLVTSHSISGPDVVDGLAAAWDEVERIGGVLLLAQMSSSGNLLVEGYAESTLEIGNASPHVLGYIGNGSSVSELEWLRSKVGEGRMIWTPGVNLSAEEGVLGQRYGHPAEAVLAGSDAIIVGSGIHKSEDPLSSAREYASASWGALLER